MFLSQLVWFDLDKVTEKRENENPLQTVLDSIVMISMAVATAEWTYLSISTRKGEDKRKMLCIVKKQPLAVQLGITCCCSGNVLPSARFKRTLERHFWISGCLSTPPSPMFAAVQAGSFLSFLSCSFGRQLSIQTPLHHIANRVTFHMEPENSVFVSNLMSLLLGILGFCPF